MTLYVYQSPSGEPEESPEAGTYSVMELRREHLKRYVFRTSQGAIILRRLPYRLKRRIDATRYIVWPKLRDMEREVADLAAGMVDLPQEQWDPEAIHRINELRVQISMHDMTALGVIVAPCLADMDEFEAMYSRLTDDEQSTLDILIQELGSIRDPSEVDATMEVIAQQYGVRLMTEEELEMMTVSQYAYHISRIAREREAVERRERELDSALGIKRVG